MYRFSAVGLTCCVVVVFFASGCATVQQSTAIPNRATVTSQRALPDKTYLPEQSAVVPGTQYIMVQGSGGSVFLGPIIGSMNISATTKAMAEKYKEQYLGVDPATLSIESISRLSAYRSDAGAAAYVVKPFAFVQYCYDEKFRVSLVYHVEGTGANKWVGRYIYYLPTVIPAANVAHPTADSLADFSREMSDAAAALTDLLQRDIDGRLPDTGTKINYGSLFIIGDKMGGLGMYQMPEELYFRNVQMVEETDRYVVVRIPGNMQATGVFGGMAFGVHRADKNQLHTLKPM